MRTKVIIILLSLLISVMIFGEEITNDIFQVEYSQKSAQKAMLFSAIVPGVGQFYADPNTVTAYIFPVLEFGLWYGYFYYQSEGDDITDQFKEYADQHYSREDQWRAQRSLILNEQSYDGFYSSEDFESDSEASVFYEISGSELYAMDEYNGSGGHFRLDHEDTQHFYEDIGKYDKYLFGWEDWTDIYASIDGTFWTNPQWIMENNEYEQGMWVGNEVQYEDSDYYLGSESLYDNDRGRYSGMRQYYIDMRREAEDNYAMKRNCTFGLLINHLLATIDAVRVTRKYNIEHLTSNPVDLKFAPSYADGTVTPRLLLSYRF